MTLKLSAALTELVFVIEELFLKFFSSESFEEFK